MITENQLEQDLQFLADTDEEAAQLKTDRERQEWIVKRTKATVIEYEEGAMELRKSKAETHEKTKEAQERYLEAFQKAEQLYNKRKTAELRIEVWRSINANRRHG